MNRIRTLELIKAHIKRRNVFLHMLAVETIMKSSARFKGENEEIWGLTGLVHDVDFDETTEEPEVHGLISETILRGKVPEEVIRAIKSHNSEHSGVPPETDMEKALIASDALSGLIIACALIMPSKKAKDVTVDTIKKKFTEKDFARGADRRRIMMCEEIGISRDKFFEIGLEGIQSRSQELGL